MKDERTSKDIAKIAARLAKINGTDVIRACLEELAYVYGGERHSIALSNLVEDIRAVAASALTQTPDRKRK